jgi:hypothetical protein
MDRVGAVRLANVRVVDQVVGRARLRLDTADGRRHLSDKPTLWAQLPPGCPTIQPQSGTEYRVQRIEYHCLFAGFGVLL